MLVDVQQAALHAALQRLTPAIPAKPAVPILGGIRLRAGADGLWLTAGNGGMTIEARLSAGAGAGDTAVRQSGQLVVPARTLLALVRCLPAGSLSLESASSSRLNIRTASAVFRLSAFAAEHYPEPALPEAAHQLRFESSRLKQLVRRLAFAAASSDARPVLTGICCSMTMAGMTFTATDGVRCSMLRLPWKAGDAAATPSSRTIIIPAHPLLAFVNAPKYEDGPATTMTAGSNGVRFECDGVCLQLPLLEGAYPSLDRIASDEPTTFLRLQAVDLLQALERSAAFAGERRLVKLVVHHERVTLSSHAEGTGDAEEILPFCTVSGMPLQITFNGAYMRDMLQTVSGSLITLSFSDPRKPIVITAPAFGEDEWLYVMTPVRTADE
ncbi:DNA polymerase III subunit beta [Paenibacillus sacheonensis]|uniref:Beta sliding clamp n=1 Tax=Paenibacillus sacheonensis TaxID=742054 RepID=A0A7X4YS65_9BACL|nr:DNA polymerase III subunit beta [Paenibacillus sacheonensis]MBM7566692.1 DNA polymerase-3 subunit beta [Paenibacillus sacheonensis]NBC70671.1 DNA polymerase III subunit beta [Paenibacillus sacheonensis]